MNCEGIWKVEMRGPYGWERIGTGFMRNGEYLGASTSHYTVGSYKQDGDDLEISYHITQYADFRTVFGIKSMTELDVTSKCKIKKNKIVCTGNAKGNKKFDVQLRLTRLDSLE